MDTPDIETVYAEIVLTLRDLGAVLRPAVAAQYDAPPGGTGATDGIPNPTLDVVSDPRRLALSDEIRRTARDLRTATRHLADRNAGLRTALARWEGDTDDDTGSATVAGA